MSILKAINPLRPFLRAPYAHRAFLEQCRLLDRRDHFLEVGCGLGRHFDLVEESGLFRDVRCVDRGTKHAHDSHANSDYLTFHPDVRFDALWCSHVLEHTQEPGPFLAKIHGDLREGGLLGLCVPPLKHEITVGHVTLWNAGLLILNLLKVGFDCREVMIRKRGYNIALLLRKKSCPPTNSFSPDSASSCRPYLPEGLSWRKNSRTGVWYFDGNIRSLGWP